MENGNGALQVVGRDQNGVMPAHSWQTMKEQAAMLVKSGFLPSAVNTPEKVIAIAMAGKELGIGFMESLRSINVIQGKPTVSPQLMLALANRTGQIENQEIISTDDKCVVKIKRRGRTAYTNEFGVSEATALGLMGKDNYRKQKKVMFQWRAIAANLRVTFPDVVLGLYTPEELGANIVEAENGDMDVHHEPLRVVETHPESNPTPTSADPEDQPGIIKNGKFQPLVAEPEIESTNINVVTIDSHKLGPDKYLYRITDEEGVAYTTFSATLYATCEEARISLKPLAIKFKRQPGKVGTKYEGQIFLNLVEAEYAALDSVKNH